MHIHLFWVRRTISSYTSSVFIRKSYFAFTDCKDKRFNLTTTKESLTKRFCLQHIPLNHFLEAQEALEHKICYCIKLLHGREYNFIVYLVLVHDKHLKRTLWKLRNVTKMLRNVVWVEIEKKGLVKWKQTISSLTTLLNIYII